METFYNGLNIATKQVVDSSANGAILSKTFNEAYEILERIASNNYQWADVRSNPGKKTRGVLEVDALASINAQLASVTNILPNLALGQDSIIRRQPNLVYIVERNTPLINVQAIRPQFSMSGIKLVKATRKIIPSQILIIRGGEIIQTSYGRDKAHTTNKCHLKQITL